jgi:hypothetical protein
MSFQEKSGIIYLINFAENRVLFFQHIAAFSKKNIHFIAT